MNFQNAYWEHANFLEGGCDVCGKETTHRCFDEPGANGIAIRSRCGEHYNRDTQRKWLKNLKRKDLETRTPSH